MTPNGFITKDGIGVPMENLGPDSEGRLGYEPLGYYTFAWFPKRCRSGRIRWLCWVEHHSDGTYTLGNRAH